MLHEMHDSALTQPMPGPELGLYHQWRENGAGWSAWKAGRDIPADATALRRPFTADGLDQGFYCTGDSVSERHGWVENVIETTEALLQEAFGLPPAPWMPN